MTHPIEASGGTPPNAKTTEGPDPVVGAGITLLGIFLMGAGGARDSHLVFDIGVPTAVIGAMIFVLFVALSALKQKRNAESAGGVGVLPMPEPPLERPKAEDDAS